MSLKHSLLVMLAEHPASGYDLSQHFKGSVGFFWNASHQQIYQQLKALSEAGWVRFSTETQADKPDKKIYELTAEGRQAMTQWLREPAEVNKYKDALLIKIYGGAHIEAEVLEAEIQRHQQLHQKGLTKLKAIEEEYLGLNQDQQKAMRLPYLTLKYGISAEENWLQWANQCLEAINDNT